MTQEEILEKNVLIAEFMGYYVKYNADTSSGSKELPYYSYNKDGETTDSVYYHLSWDWLMPVLERIEAIGYKWEIGMSIISPQHYCRIWSIGTINGISALDATYGAVITFIKWYNQNKK